MTAANRILGMAFRAIVQAVEDSGPFQLLKISGLADEIREGIPRLGQYGFGSHPPSGTDAIGLALGGTREGLVIIATDSKGRRKTTLAGEAWIHNEVTGESVLLKADGTIRLGENATDPVIRRSDLVAVFSNALAVPVPNDGGAALKSAWTNAANSAGSAKVFAK